MLLTILTVLFLIAVLLLAGPMWTVAMRFTTQIQGLVTATYDATLADETGVLANPNVLAAQPAVLTTRTNNTSGSLTMTNSSHGIITGQRVDLYWTGGHCYGAIVGTVSGTTVPIASVIGGDNLPIATTVINVGICESSPFSFTGDNLTGLALSSPDTAGYIVVADGSNSLYAVYLPSGGVDFWNTGLTGTNPLAGDTPTKVFFSHSTTTSLITTMRAGAIVH